MAEGSPSDELLVRRLLELELRQVKDAMERLDRQLKEEVQRLDRAATAGPPWWTSYLFAVLFAMISGWIGLVHRGMHTNSVETARLASVQDQHLYIPPALEDVKRRLSASEALALRIPYMENQLRDFGVKMDGLGKDFGIKLDRLFEQRGRQGQTVPGEDIPMTEEGNGPG